MNWFKLVYMLDFDLDNNGFINEDFIVWMCIVVLFIFCKLYCFIERKSDLYLILLVG